MLVSIVQKNFPSKCPTNEEFIAIMRKIQAESGAQSAEVCDATCVALKEAGAKEEAWLKLLDLVKPEVLSVHVAQPGIFGRLWNAIFGPQVIAPVAEASVPSKPDSHVAEAPASVAQASVAEASAPSKPDSQASEAPVPVAETPVPEPEVLSQSSDPNPNTSAPLNKNEVSQVQPNQNASAKEAPVQQKKKNQGRK